ncbi:MAG: efflux RND transporter permease subunit [Kiritimatiellae bacterium]|nr:efflux RND transporter permease subunit [Kiritimatiellia bacterium]
MNTATWCIRNNRTSVIGFILVALAGLTAYRTLPRLESPDFTIRVALVVTYFPGASPQKVENLITDKLEAKLQEMPEVKLIESQSMTGISIVSVEMQAQYMDMQPIWTRLRNKVDDVRADLPDGVIGPNVNDEFGDVFPVLVALTGDGYSYREMKDAADDLRSELLALPDVAKVELFGTQDERIFVEFSNARLAELELSPQQLAAAMNSQNVLQPGGDALVGPERVTLEATGEFKTVDDIRQVSLRRPGASEAVYLQDVATVRRGFVDPPSSLTHYNGESCLVLAASMIADGKVTDMGPRVLAKVREFASRLPIGLDCHPFFYQHKYVERSMSDFMSNLVEAFGFVVAVMLAFAGLRMGLITGALVPMAMFMCIGLMPLFGIQLHQISIAALIIALGMLVDNGIVTSENILVRLVRGQDRLEAAGGAMKELWLPLLTSSLTTICAFLPIATAKSDVGEYCFSLFQVIALTLLSSWLLSITMVPLLCYYFLKPKPAQQAFDSRLYRVYRRFLLWALGHRPAFLAAMVGLFAASLWGFRFIPNIFFPPNEREMLLIDFWQPYGTDIRTTERRVERLENYLLAQTGLVRDVATFVGSGGPRWYLALNIEQDNPNYANLVVNTVDTPAAQRLMPMAQAYLDGEFPDCRATVKMLENGPPVGAPIQIRLYGKEIDALYAVRARIEESIRDVPGVANIRDDWGEWTKKLEVQVNQEQAKRAGFTSEDVANSLQAQISGMPVTQFREEDEIIPVLLRSKSAYREDLGNVESLHVYSYATGANLPLLQVARTRLEWQPSIIRRRDRTRMMTIKMDVEGRFASDVLAEIQPRVDALRDSPDWPAGYAVEYGGEDADSAEAQASISAGLPLAMGLLVLILVAQFNSIRRPLIIVLTIPPVLIGVVPGLLLTAAPFGFMAFLGLISLAGVVVNNAIMLIDRMEIEKGLGQGLEDAIVVSAQRRLRPILMTAITTIVGLAPLSLQGGEMWRPMANTIMFGLAIATVLSLVLCPVLYSYFFRARFKGYAWTPAALEKTKE